MMQKRNAPALATTSPGQRVHPTTQREDNSTNLVLPLDDRVVITLVIDRDTITPRVEALTNREVTPADIRLARIIAFAADVALQTVRGGR